MGDSRHTSDITAASIIIEPQIDINRSIML